MDLKDRIRSRWNEKTSPTAFRFESPISNDLSSYSSARSSDDARDDAKINAESSNARLEESRRSPILSSWDTEQNKLSHVTSNSEPKQTGSVNDFTAQNTENKIALQTCETLTNACEEPGFHCGTEVPAGTSTEKEKNETQGMDEEAHFRARWEEKMASPSAFKFESPISNDLFRHPSVSASNVTAWSSDDAGHSTKIDSSLTEFPAKTLQSCVNDFGKWATDMAPPSSSTFGSEQNTGFRGTHSSNPTQNGFINDVFAESTNNKTASSSNSNEPVGPCKDPRIHCRPKVRTGKPSLSSKPSGKENIPEQPKCDEKFECEAWQDGEESAKSAFKRCAKNPGHEMFYPVKTFSLKYLPEEYQSQVYLKGINSVADLTMRIGVDFTSKARPPSDIFAKFRGTRIQRWGTGFVQKRLFTNNTTNMEFPDDFTDHGQEDSGMESDFSAKYANKNYEKRLKHFLTSVFPSLNKNENEAALKAMEPVMKAARGVKGFFDWVSDYNYIRNSGDFDGIFDDNDDFKRLYEYDVMQRLQRLDLRDSSHFVKSLPNKFLKSTPGNIALKICEMKELWFGPLYRRQQPMTKCERACRLLIRLKRREWVINGIDEFCGKVRGDNDTDSASPDDYQFVRNDDEDVEEDDNRPNTAEERGKETKSMKTETLGNNQDGRPDDDLQDHFDELEDEDRIEDLMDDDWNDVIEIVRPCKCRLCTESAEPEQKGYSVNVITARHVVYDQEEAQKTVVDLFYDDETKDGVKHLYGVDVHVSSNPGDFAILMCATHDENLIKDLQKLIKTADKRVEKMKAKSNTPLAVICSHPHGNYKHISVGSWITREIFRRRDRLPPFWTSYIYDTSTCRGSSGAPVLILGHRSGTLSLDSLLHPHHGHKEKNLNRSSRLVSFYRHLDDMNPKARKRVLDEQEEVYKKVMEELKERTTGELRKLRRSAETVQKLKDAFCDAFLKK